MTASNSIIKKTLWFYLIIPVNSPEKVRLGVEFELGSIDVKVKLWRSGVGDADGDDQVLWILAQLKRGSYHDEGDADDVHTYNNRKAEELLRVCTQPDLCSREPK